jgi:hypothetical protein
MSHDSTLDFRAFITLPVCVLTSTLLIVSEPVHYQLVRYYRVRARNGPRRVTGHEHQNTRQATTFKAS